MAASKDVLAVLGMLCVSQPFRTEFFTDPQAKAASLVGALRPDEIEQVMWLAGQGATAGLTSNAFCERLKMALASVYAAIDCPDPPCPDNPFTSALV